MMRTVAVAVACTLVCGCTHLQLKRNTLGQFRTVSDLHQQQVLDNLAMFIYDPNSFPYFNVLSTGVNEVTDSGSMASTTTLTRTIMNLFQVGSEIVNISAMRNMRENWSANPVNDPRRLELMRCAYQKAVAARMCEPGALSSVSATCPDCEQRWKAFYGVDKNNQIVSDGKVTSECLGSHGPWFAWGCKKDVPKLCGCEQVGHYCGVYVWVLPGGADELTKLTLAILDYAVNQPAYTLTKDVTLNLDAKGNLVKGADAVRTIKATIPVTIPSVALLKNEVGDTSKMDIGPELRQRIDTVLPPVQGPYQNSLPPDFQFLNQRLQQLNPPR